MFLVGNILFVIILIALTAVVVVAISWASIYTVLDIISRLKEYKKGTDDWRIDL